jgi:hypothetical protein
LGHNVIPGCPPARRRAATLWWPCGHMAASCAPHAGMTVTTSPLVLLIAAALASTAAAGAGDGTGSTQSRDSSTVISTVVSVPKKLAFADPLFTDGMLLQRGTGTRIWGSGAEPHSTVTVSLLTAGGPTANASSVAGSGGNWTVVLPPIAAAKAATLSVSDGIASAQLSEVAVGDLILCGGQSNVSAVAGAGIVPSEVTSCCCRPLKCS